MSEAKQPLTTENWQNAMELLGGESLRREAGLHGPVTLIRRGLSVGHAARFATRAKLSQKDVLRLLGLPKSTYSRQMKAGGLLSPQSSDKLFRAARVTVRACEVFEDEDIALDWLRSPNQALGGERPYDLLDTDAGTEAVEDLLGRIEYGVYS
jgi:putative toxin-antitoxin system antitoxin component (TIGR02293 family)